MTHSVGEPPQVVLQDSPGAFGARIHCGWEVEFGGQAVEPGRVVEALVALAERTTAAGLPENWELVTNELTRWKVAGVMVLRWMLSRC